MIRPTDRGPGRGRTSGPRPPRTQQGSGGGPTGGGGGTKGGWGCPLSIAAPAAFLLALSTLALAWR